MSNSLLTNNLPRTLGETPRMSSFDIILTPDSTITATSPAWIVAFTKRIQTLLDLPANWDGDGAESLSLSCVIEALEFLFSIMSHDLLAPQVVPTSEGGLQLEWHTGGIDIEVTFTPRGRANFFLSHGSSPDLEGEVADHAIFLSTTLRTLRARDDRPIAR
jgi:hypothetical protein